MAYHNLTSSDQIRSVLTVSQADLPDETLDAYGLEDDLAVDLDNWATDWSSIVDVTQARLLRLYAKYFCAGTVAATAPVFVLTKMSDGDNEGQRSGNEGFLWLSKALLAKAAGYRSQLLEVLGTAQAVSSVPLLSRVPPARDVITQARSSAS